MNNENTEPSSVIIYSALTILHYSFNRFKLQANQIGVDAVLLYR